MIRFVLVALLFAVLVYLFVRLIDRRNLGPGRSKGARPRGPQQGPGSGRRTIAPDDDEQFLRDLDRKRKDEPPAP
ncbi:MAG TPA: hypothetical protein VFK52_06660 [Nocardioidaceae bacterium]|nr:hypothetical protein [Nocardioidaceae bacterium]